MFFFLSVCMRAELARNVWQCFGSFIVMRQKTDVIAICKSPIILKKYAWNSAKTVRSMRLE